MIDLSEWPVEEGYYKLGEFEVERGGVIREARLGWQTHGTLSAKLDNVIIYPCSYTATHHDLSWLIRPGGILDPTRWFIVIPDMFSNGISSSASEEADFPELVTMRDNVFAQRRMMKEQFGVEEVAAVYGFSMGAGQAFHWAAEFPDAVDKAIIVCGSARTSVHNQVFLSGLLRILEAAPQYLGGGRFSSEPEAAIRAFGQVYAGWGLSQDFYRAGLHMSALGASNLTDFLVSQWEDSFLQHRAADLYSQARTWYEADISASQKYGGDLGKALSAITAKVLLLPSESDLYFRVADNAAELEYLTRGELHPIPSIWGHRAGSPIGNPEDEEFIRVNVERWLQAD